MIISPFRAALTATRTMGLCTTMTGNGSRPYIALRDGWRCGGGGWRQCSEFTLERLWKCLPVERLGAASPAAAAAAKGIFCGYRRRLCVHRRWYVRAGTPGRLGDAWHVNRHGGGGEKFTFNNNTRGRVYWSVLPGFYTSSAATRFRTRRPGPPE